MHAYLELGPDVWNMAQVHPSVADTKQLVNHALVRPLREQGRDRVIASIQYQKHRRRVCPAEVEQLLLLRDDVADFACQLLGHETVPFVSDQGLLLQRQQSRDQPLGRASQGVGIPQLRATPPYFCLRICQVEREEIWIDDDVIGKVLLHRSYNLVVVCLSEAFQGGLAHDVAKICLTVRSFVDLIANLDNVHR